MPSKILFLVPYPLKESPSQRFRFEQYFDLLKIGGHQYFVQSFLDSQNWQLFFKKGNVIKKGYALSKGFVKRLRILLKSPLYDFVFIHREAAPVGPPMFEWFLAHVFGRKIIYDFDDAIWLTDRKQESKLLRLIKWRRKVQQIIKWSYKVSCGNEYLCSHASQFNNEVNHIPTTIDTENWHNPALYRNEKKETISIGWTGSHSTLKYLTDIEAVLAKIQHHFNVELIVIADKKPAFSKAAVTYIPWNSQTEIEDLMKFDIGIMPLPDDKWAKGKCGFKALQYMALKIPAIVSPVGVNTKIIEHDVNGFFARNEEEWFTYLSKLVTDKSLRNKMGDSGRQKVVNNYSVKSNASAFLSLFE